MSEISGTLTCSNCGEDFLWDYSFPQYLPHISPFAEVKALNTKAQHAIRLNNKHDDDVLLGVYCKFCRHFNEFIYKVD